MKWLFFISLFVISICALGTSKAYRAITIIRDTVPQGAPQLFGAKNYEFKNYVLVDSFIMNRGGDTNNIPYWPSLKFKRSDRRWYAYDSVSWKRLLYTNDTANQNLQQVTDVGRKTTDTIISGGLMTQNIVTDTTDMADYEFDVIGDIHVQLSKPEIVYARTNWIRDNRASENIKAVFQLGDLTNDATNAPFRIVDTSFRTLDTFDIPYITVPGNHDYPGNAPCGRDLTTYNTFFGASRYAGKTWYGGNYNNSNGNSYIKFEVGTKKYMAIGFETWPTDSMLAWGQRVLDSFPDREAIILTHGYITYYNERNVDTSVFSHIDYGGCGTNGQQLWDRFIKLNRQISFVFAGHFIPIDYSTNRTPVVHRITESGIYGNVINQFVVNYQQDTSLGGNTYMMRMKFKPRNGNINISFYSPYANVYDTIRNPAYTISYPALNVQPTTGFASKSNFYDEARFDSSVYITKLVKGKAVITNASGLLDTGTVSNGLSLSLVNKTISLGQDVGATNNPAILSSNREIPTNGYNTVFTGTGKVGIGTNSPTYNLDVNGQAGVSSANYPTLGFNGNFPARFYVVAPGSNWGLATIRATTDAGGANLAFYKTRNTDASIRTGPSVNDVIGRISFQTPTANGAIVANGAQFQILSGTPANTYVPMYFQWGTVASNGSYAERMRLSTEGNLYVGASIDAADKLHVAGTTKITDTLKLPNILSKVDTTNYKPTVVDASGNIFKMGGWPESHSALTSGVIPVATTNGRLIDGPLTYSGTAPFDQLTLTSGAFQTPTGITIASNNTLLSGNNLTFGAGDFLISRGSGSGNLLISAKTGIGSSSITPTAKLHLEAGTAVAGTAPLKLTSGTVLTTPETGAIEYDGTHFYGTVGSTRYQLDQQAGTTYTFNNGLTNTSGTVQLGGTLLQNTTVNTGGFTTTWTGANDNQTSFSVTNTGTTEASAISGTASGTTSIGVSGTSTSYIGVFGSSTSNNGIQGQSSSATGVVGVSSTGAAFRGQINPTSTNAIENIITLLRTSSSGGGANGIGSALQFELETATNGTSQTAGSIAYQWTDATNATRTSQFEIYGVNSATTARKLAVAGTGQLTLDTYGVSTFTGTAATMPAFTSAGAVIEVPVNLTGSATLDFPNTNAGTSSDLTITVTGAADGDVVAIGVPNGSTVANGCFTAWVSATNTITVRFSNNDLTTAYNPASGTFKATVIKH